MKNNIREIGFILYRTDASRIGVDSLIEKALELFKNIGGSNGQYVIRPTEKVQKLKLKGRLGPGLGPLVANLNGKLDAISFYSLLPQGKIVTSDYEVTVELRLMQGAGYFSAWTRKILERPSLVEGQFLAWADLLQCEVGFFSDLSNGSNMVLTSLVLGKEVEGMNYDSKLEWQRYLRGGVAPKRALLPHKLMIVDPTKLPDLASFAQDNHAYRKVESHGVRSLYAIPTSLDCVPPRS